MREIVILQVGGAGNKIGSKFWELIAQEHGVMQTGAYAGQSDLQLERLNVYFNETQAGRFVPRSVNVDLDPTMERHGSLLDPNSFIMGWASTGNNYAKGRLTDGAQFSDQTMDKVRQLVEQCDLIQGFQIIHAIGGGCGSGLNSLLLDRINQEYPDRVCNTFSILPSPKTSEIVVENYNAIFALNHLMQTSDETIIYDNEALYHITNDVLHTAGSFSEYNQLISACIGGVTACFRFPGQLNADLRKLAVNMVPYPRMHFMAPAFVPLVGRNTKPYANLTVPLLVQQMFDPQYLQAACDPRKGRYLCCASVFRGLVRMSEVEESMWSVRDRHQQQFVQWLPNSSLTAVCDIPPCGQKLAATFLGNTTAITEVFDRCMQRFLAMFRRRANVHWYTGEGMEEAEFEEAQLGVSDLIQEYKMHENASV